MTSGWDKISTAFNSSSKSFDKPATYQLFLTNSTVRNLKRCLFRCEIIQSSFKHQQNNQSAIAGRRKIAYDLLSSATRVYTVLSTNELLAIAHIVNYDLTRFLAKNLPAITLRIILDGKDHAMFA